MLSKSDKVWIADSIKASIDAIVLPKVEASPVEVDVEETTVNEVTGKTEYTDPVLRSLHEAKGKIIDNLAANGGICKTRIVVGRYGATEINDTKVALNMLDDQIKDYKDRKTHTKMR
jgi:hypothetical protein